MRYSLTILRCESLLRDARGTSSLRYALRYTGSLCSMRHGYKLARLGRSSKLRRAMLKNLTASLVEHERIQTTVPRAKAMKKVGDWVRRFTSPRKRILT